VLYHCPSRRQLQDVVTCIRLHTTIDHAGFQKERHADRFLKTPQEMLAAMEGCKAPTASFT
jgi:error-prone DNA polymerase